MTAFYTTTIHAIHNNEKQRMSRTVRMVLFTCQLTVVRQGQVRMNIIHRTKTARRCNPCISGSNTFWNIIVTTEKLSIFNRCVSQPSTTAQKKEHKAKKLESGPLLVPYKQMHQSDQFRTMLLLLTPSPTLVLQGTVYHFLIGRKDILSRLRSIDHPLPRTIRSERYVSRRHKSFPPERLVQGEGP